MVRTPFQNTGHPHSLEESGPKGQQHPSQESLLRALVPVSVHGQSKGASWTVPGGCDQLQPATSSELETQGAAWKRGAWLGEKGALWEDTLSQALGQAAQGAASWRLRQEGKWWTPRGRGASLPRKPWRPARSMDPVTKQQTQARERGREVQGPGTERDSHGRSQSLLLPLGKAAPKGSHLQLSTLGRKDQGAGRMGGRKDGGGGRKDGGGQEGWGQEGGRKDGGQEGTRGRKGLGAGRTRGQEEWGQEVQEPGRTGGRKDGGRKGAGRTGARRDQGTGRTGGQEGREGRKDHGAGRTGLGGAGRGREGRKDRRAGKTRGQEGRGMQEGAEGAGRDWAPPLGCPPRHPLQGRPLLRLTLPVLPTHVGTPSLSSHLWLPTASRMQLEPSGMALPPDFGLFGVTSTPCPHTEAPLSTHMGVAAAPSLCSTLTSMPTS